MTTKPPHVCSKCKRTLTRARYCDACMKAKRPNTQQRKDNVRLYKSKRWQQQKRDFLSKHPFCAWILADGKPCMKPAYIVDHIVPRFKGGPDHPCNYQPVCIPHHGVKSAIEAGRLPPSHAHPSNLRMSEWRDFSGVSKRSQGGRLQRGRGVSRTSEDS